MKDLITNKRTLVTGGAGFIGSNLCEALLDADNEVICLDNFITGKHENIEPLQSRKGFRLIDGDIRDAEVCARAVREVDVVFHQAALGSVPRSIEDPIKTNSINIDGFLQVLNAAHKGGVKRFVYAASSSTYGDSTALPKVEDQIGKPLSPYAVTKYVNELYASVYARLFNMETIGLRYFNVFGRHQDPDGAYAAAIPRFIKAYMSHQAPQIHGDGLQTRDFTYIENVIQANMLAGSTQKPEALNQVFNVACGSQVTLLELNDLLRKLLSEFDPEIANIKPLHVDPRVGDVRQSLASIDKASSLLGYHPTRDLKAGLEEAISWYWRHLR